MGALEGRVAVITGAGRGIGREHALLFAKEGAKVVVNDLGGSNEGEGADTGPAHEVVDEITAAGGVAVANTENVATWSGAESVVQQAIDEFGGLDILVNNAGILRDAFIAGMEEAQWDAVIAVHLKGHFAMLHHAAAYWKAQSKAGDQPNAAVINTASGSGVTLPNAGQANYGSAKAGIAALTLDRRRGTGALRGAGQRDRTDRADPAHAGHARHGFADERTRGRRARPVQPGQHLAAGGLPGHREVPDHREGVRGAGRCDFVPVGLARRRHDRDRRAVADRRHRRPAAAVVEEQNMFEWSDTDLIMRDTIRGFIDKEIRPNLDALETGEISPYPIARKLFSEFGLDVLAAEAVKTMLDKERAQRRPGKTRAPTRSRPAGSPAWAPRLRWPRCWSPKSPG